jgi:hypothetical protein
MGHGASIFGGNLLQLHPVLLLSSVVDEDLGADFSLLRLVDLADFGVVQVQFAGDVRILGVLTLIRPKCFLSLSWL